MSYKGWSNEDYIDYIDRHKAMQRAINFNKRRLTTIALCVGLALGKKLSGRDFA